MLLSVGFVNVLFGFAVAAGSSQASYSEADITKIDSNNIESYLKTNELVMLEFFTPWCSHCKNLAPELGKAAEILQEKDIAVAQFDCYAEEDFCIDMDVTSFPTLQVYRFGELETNKYDGDRTSDAIVDYMLKKKEPIVTVVKSEEQFEALLGSSYPLVINAYRNFDPAFNQTFYDAAVEGRDKSTFIQVTLDEINNRFNVSDNAVFVIHADELEEEDEDSIPKFEFQSGANLTQFLEVETMPLFSDINGSNAKHYEAAGLPLAYFFYLDYEAERQLMTPLMKALARKHRGEMNFVALNANRYGIHAKNLYMEPKFPLFALLDYPTGLKYGMNQTDGLKPREIEGWLEDFLEGKLTPNEKPRDDEGDFEDYDDSNETVISLDSKSHNKAIADKSKITLVEYYTDWCPHCKRLAPIYDKIAKTVAGNSDYVIAKLEYEKNKVDVKVTGFPTIMLYNKGAKPVTFSGVRGYKEILDFLGYSETRVHDEL